MFSDTPSQRADTVSTRRRHQHCPPRRQLQSPLRVLLLALRPSCCFKVFCLHGLDFWNWQHPFSIMALRCQGQMEKGTKPYFHFQNKLMLSHRGLASWATWHSLPWSHLCCLPARAIRSFESSLQAPDPHLPVWAGRTSPISLRGRGPQDKSGPISFSCSPAENQAVSFTSALLPALHLRNEHLLSRGASAEAGGLILPRPLGQFQLSGPQLCLAVSPYSYWVFLLPLRKEREDWQWDGRSKHSPTLPGASPSAAFQFCEQSPGLQRVTSPGARR